MKKRLISLLLALVMVFTLLPISAFAASNKDVIWDFLKSKGFSDAGAAGIMGNIQQESAFRPNNLEDRYEASLKMNDDEYTAAVDNGTYSKDSFVHDSAGYGLFQWTFYTRKESMYNYIKNTCKASIGDLTAQLNFMYSEMSSSLKAALKETDDVSEACIMFHDEYEQSADTETMKQTRVRYAMGIYDTYSSEGGAPTDDSIVILNYNYPKSVETGKSFTLYGTVISGQSNLTSLTVGVYNSSGVMQTGTTVFPGSRSYSISDVDSYVKFGSLSVGTYYYKVIANNFSNSTELLNEMFKVENSHTHSYGSTWKFNSTKHWQECWCEEVRGKANHTFGSWRVTSPNICVQSGIRERSCTVCGYKQTETVEKLGHDYFEGVCTRCGEKELVITSQPVSVSAGVGTDVSFRVAASGSGLSYQWQYKTPGGAYWNASSSTGANTAELTVKATDARNGQQYRCVIKNNSGNTVNSTAAKITVLPKITAQPKDVTAEAGKSVTFSVTANGKGLSYQWQYKTPDGAYWNASSSTGANTAELTVKATDARNGQQYRCVITNGNGNKVTSAAAKLTVTSSLSISSQPKNVTAEAGKTVTFRVSADGKGLSYQWQYKTQGGTYWNTSSSTGAKTAELTVKATDARNGQQYRCVVTDASGNKVTSNAAKITVIPAITSQPENAAVGEGKYASFRVAVSGSGLSYRWQYKKAGESDWYDSTSTGAKTAELTVKATDARNGQQYRCIITNASGNKVTSDAAKIIIVPVITSQPEDATAAVGKIVTFSLTATGNGLSYQWQYKKAGGNVWYESSSTGADTAKLSIKATDARNGQQYRCVIMNASGNSVISDPAIITVRNT